jgi:hypothetical protein
MASKRASNKCIENEKEISEQNNKLQKEYKSVLMEMVNEITYDLIHVMRR